MIQKCIRGYLVRKHMAVMYSQLLQQRSTASLSRERREVVPVGEEEEEEERVEEVVEAVTDERGVERRRCVCVCVYVCACVCECLSVCLSTTQGTRGEATGS